MSTSFNSETERDAVQLIDAALREDLGEAGDITSQAVLQPDWTGTVSIVARSPGVAAGLPLVPLILNRNAASLQWSPAVDDGAVLAGGTCLGRISGSLQALLAVERTVLNFLTHLSGVATLTRHCVEQVAGTSAVILDTRKTLPGWRRLQKYAVAVGGGVNHRTGLFDAVLIKDNHIAAWRQHTGSLSLCDLISLARSRTAAGTTIEIEVDTLEQFEEVLPGRPDIILLDNFSLDELREAHRRRSAEAPEVLLEASGGLTLEQLASVAATGVDRISIGRLTHSAPALDIGFDWENSRPA